ncbi:MAG: hypothetical protein U9R00_03300 [Patescibacteria group bacterium]|nr:hypothetical protein [Patescibacteria group bacterium]
MTYDLPENMDELVYFTRRKLDPNGKVFCWVPKNPCSKCKKGIMAKPKDPKTGKPKIRAKEYVCDSCGNIEDKESYEKTLMAYANYTCPHCGKEGSSKGQYKRKTIKGVSTLRLECEHCGGNIDVTKKMKAPKPPKTKKKK